MNFILDILSGIGTLILVVAGLGLTAVYFNWFRKNNTIVSTSAEGWLNGWFSSLLLCGILAYCTIGFVAGIFYLIGIVLVKYWWVFLIIIAIIGGLIALGSNKKE